MEGEAPHKDEPRSEANGQEALRSKDGRVRRRTKRLLPTHELGKEHIRDAIQKVGRPWYNRKRYIPLWKVKAYRTAGFSLRQVGELFGVSATTIKRRLREQN